MKKIKTFGIINIKREIVDVSDFLKNFIFDNINYSRSVWNDFVEESRTYDSLYSFKPLTYHTQYTPEHERKNSVYYCEGVSKNISRRCDESIRRCIKNTKNDHKHHELRFKSFDKYYGTFSVDARPYMFQMKDGSYRCNTKCNIIDTKIINFRANRNLFIPITLSEPLFYDVDQNGYMILDKMVVKGFTVKRFDKRCRYRVQDIRQITFIHEIGHFYIQLAVRVKFVNSKTEINSRKDIAGIDMGIHNPLCITDNSKNYIMKMSNKTMNRIHYLERRVKRLQHIMGIKYNINKDRGINPQSKNYEKVRKKYRSSLIKIKNLKLDWRRKVCKEIATTYKMVVVDTYRIPTVHETTNNVAIRKFNTINRFYSMSELIEYLPHACIKYGTKYIESPKNTTRTCSVCGHLNPHLQLSQRIFKCEKCGYTTDRDVNASQNCYDHGLQLIYS